MNRDASVRDAFTDLVTAAGHRVQAFASIEAFWQAYEPDVPGCVVLDLDLGVHVDGTDAVVALARDPRLRHPVMIITDADNDHRLARRIEAGINTVYWLAGDEFLNAIENASDTQRRERGASDRTRDG